MIGRFKHDVFEGLDMVDEEAWKTDRMRERSSNRTERSGALNIALVFGVAGIALTLILTPMLAGNSERKTAAAPQNYDMITTGSIESSDGGGRRYTLRRSVLQETPGSVCIVEGYGADSGC